MREVRFVLQPPVLDSLSDAQSSVSIALGQLEHFYSNVAGYYGKLQGPVAVEFNWRHGSPFPAGFYRDAIGRQNKIFGSTLARVTNTIQIRLEAVDEEVSALCKRGALFDAAGILVALYEGPTADGDSHSSIPSTLARLRNLQAQGINSNYTTILSKRNVSHVEDIFRFFEQSETRTCHVLPLFQQPSLLPPYCHADELTAPETRTALERMVELTLTSDSGLRVEPIDRYIEQVLDHHDPKQPCRFHTRRGWERSYVVQSGGEVCGAAEAGDIRRSYGNVFQSQFEAIVSGVARQSSIAASERRMAALCAPCRFFGSCAGDPVAEGPSDETSAGGPDCALVRPMLEYVERRVHASGTLRRRMSSINVERPIPTPHVTPRPDERDLIAEFEDVLCSLQPGVRVRVFSDGPAPAMSRLMLSSGTRTASPAAGVRYHVGAIVPREPWRKPTPAEHRWLTVSNVPSTDTSWQMDSDVAVIRLPDDVTSPVIAICEECGIYGSDSAKRASPAEHPNWGRVTRTLADHLREYCLDDRPIEATVLYRSDPGLTAVTKIDRGIVDQEAYIGLHLDSWEGASLRRRSDVRNRLCINLAPQVRYFLFINLTLADMMRSLGLADSDDLQEVSLFAGHKFMRRYPSYPVVRLELGPQEAYIAPTGNLVHDGASPVGQHPDLALHLLGYFGVPANVHIA